MTTIEVIQAIQQDIDDALTKINAIMDDPTGIKRPGLACVHLYKQTLAGAELDLSGMADAEAVAYKAYITVKRREVTTARYFDENTRPSNEATLAELTEQFNDIKGFGDMIIVFLTPATREVTEWF